MNAVYKCPNGHVNSWRVTECSPDINCIDFEPEPCEECECEFDDKTWKFLDYEYDDPD